MNDYKTYNKGPFEIMINLKTGHGFLTKDPDTEDVVNIDLHGTDFYILSLLLEEIKKDIE